MAVGKKEPLTTRPVDSLPVCSACSSKKKTLQKSQPAEPIVLKSSPRKQAKTRIVVQYDCGFGNKLFIRGEGISTLSWNKGEPMINLSPSEWVYETDRPFSVARFKVLLNDSEYESGENHAIAYGKEAAICPTF
jgi:hypothetical protein